MLSVARAAAGRSVCMMHVHPMSRGDVHFSFADDVGDVRTHAFFARMIPDAMHASIVFDSTLDVAEARHPGTASDWQRMDVQICGNAGRFRDVAATMSRRDIGRFHRQQRLLGRDGQGRLGKLTIVVVGAGGLGSLISAGLVHSGVGSVIAIDNDSVDETSLHRLLGAAETDVLGRTKKVRIAECYAKTLDSKIPFRGLEGFVEDPAFLPTLTQAGAIICCTDTTRSRSYLNQPCYQYSVPLLDLGRQFQVESKSSRLIHEIGKINLVTPEPACLVCTGHVQPEMLYAESLNDEERRDLAERGYVRGLAGPEPSMQMYNMQVAGRGLQRLLNHLLDVQPVSPTSYERLSFLGITGRPYWTEVAKRSDSECLICGAQSLLRGAGSTQAMLIAKPMAA